MSYSLGAAQRAYDNQEPPEIDPMVLALEEVEDDLSNALYQFSRYPDLFRRTLIEARDKLDLLIERNGEES